MSSRHQAGGTLGGVCGTLPQETKEFDQDTRHLLLFSCGTVWDFKQQKAYIAPPERRLFRRTKAKFGRPDIDPELLAELDHPETGLFITIRKFFKARGNSPRELARDDRASRHLVITPKGPGGSIGGGTGES